MADAHNNLCFLKFCIWYKKILGPLKSRNHSQSFLGGNTECWGQGTSTPFIVMNIVWSSVLMESGIAATAVAGPSWSENWFKDASGQWNEIHGLSSFTATFPSTIDHHIAHAFGGLKKKCVNKMGKNLGYQVPRDGEMTRFWSPFCQRVQISSKSFSPSTYTLQEEFVFAEIQKITLTR